MLMKQPFYVGGIHDVEKSKSSAFGAAGMFFFTFIVSIFYMIHDARRVMEEDSDHPRHSSRRGEYGQVPVADLDFDTPQQFDRGAVFT